MSDDDKQSLNDFRKNVRNKTAEDYIREMRMYGDTPKDQFSHQFKLLFHVQEPPHSQMDLLPPDAILGGVKESKTLWLLQKDNEVLNRLYDMGLRSEGIMDLFDSLFYSWWQQCRMTGMLGFTERWLQSFLEPGATPFESFSFMEKRAAKKASKKFNIRDQLRGITGRGEGEGRIYE